MMTEESKRAWETAKKWYKPCEIYERIQKANKILQVDTETIPVDIYSKEFSEWLTNEFVHAMAKGIQLGIANNF